MGTHRRTLFIAAGAVAFVLLLLLALPFLFRDRIAARMQAAVSGTVDADVRWAGVGLSLLRNFPNATLRLDDLSIVGRDRFAGDTLAHVPRFRLVVALPSLVRSMRGAGPLEVRTIEVDGAALYLHMLEDGAANWELFPPREAAAPARPLELELRRLALRDGAIRFDDRQGGVSAAVTGLQQTLAGDFRQTRFRVESRTSADSVSLRVAGVPYLSDARLGIDAAFDVDTEAGRVAISHTDVTLNGLRLALSGAVATGADTLALDVAFSAPGTAFEEILSLLPMLYTQPGFADLRTAGTMAVSGSVRGGYGAGAFPAFDLAAAVRDGRFQYPDLPLPARDVFLDLAVSNPGGSPDSTVVRVDRFHVVIGSDPIAGTFELRTPISDPALDLRVNGRLDLAELNRTLKLPGAEELAGNVAADASVRARRSHVESGQYEQVVADGTVRAGQIVLRMEDLPHAVQVEEALLRLSPSHAELETFRGTIGSSDVSVTARLDNLLGYAFRDDELRGSARIASARFDLDEWRSDDELQAVLVPPNIDFALDADIQRLLFAELDLRNARGSLRIRDQRATLDDVRLELFGGTMAVNGYYETTVPARPVFDIALAITSLDVGQAAAGMNSVRVLAPAARYAQGRMSTDLRLSGAVGDDMAPIYEALSGRGTFETAGLSLQGFPALDRLADVLRTEQLRNPGFVDVRSSFQIRDGRLHVSPFDVGLGPFSATVGGSHGIDETMDYTMALRLPRALLGAEANRAVGVLAAQAGRAGLGWEAADAVTLAVQIGGTIASPTLATDFRGATTTALQDAGTAVRGELERRFEEVEQRADAAAAEARRRAAEEAARILEEAERQAERLRAEAVPLADAVRREGYQRADALVAQAGNPAARLAAQAGADRLRREADASADRILREADERADALVEAARRRAESVTGGATVAPGGG